MLVFVDVVHLSWEDHSWREIRPHFWAFKSQNAIQSASSQTSIATISRCIFADSYIWVSPYEGQGSLACCDSWVCKESDTTEQLNWTELMSGRNEPAVLLVFCWFFFFFFCVLDGVFVCLKFPRLSLFWFIHWQIVRSLDQLGIICRYVWDSMCSLFIS